ncbi:Vps5 C terminal like-domain-containing protein [Infundibulicybe gibba]|nr:Vps5 C terminal like-domain-containing protein [Infundibulicybe gibba]
MFDPLNSTASIFGGATEEEQPPWPTTPHPPHSPIPNLRRASPPNPPIPDKGPAPGLYGKEPQIYGQPEAGLISPRVTVGSNGTQYEKPEPYLRVRITGLDRNRRDILVKLDAQTNLSNFTGTTYRNVSRSYLEFQQFYESVIHSNPQTIVPALPLAQTSAPTDEEDDRLVKIMLQRWITRVCEDPILVNDEDLRSFIESDFGYQPTPRPRRKTSSGFGIIRRGVPDEDEDLQRARFELTKLEGQFFDTAKAVDKLAITRKALAGVHSEMGNKLINVATTEAHPPLGTAFRKIGRTWHSLVDLDQAQAISECVVLGDSLGYQGMNARSAKETLLMRTGVLEEYQTAVKTTISKRRHIERLKASSNIRPDRVDEALEEMEEANKYEQVLAKRAEGISQNLHRALATHNRHANDDITTALIEHVRSSIMYERQLLRELEALRGDVNNAASKVAPVSNGSQNPPRPQPTAPESNPGFGPIAPRSQQQRPEPLAANSLFPSHQTTTSHLPTQSLSRQSGSMQSPGAGPSTPTSGQMSFAKPPTDEPPLGGRFVDGTKSMFVKTTSSPTHPPTLPKNAPNPGPLSGSRFESPLHNTFNGSVHSPLHNAPQRGIQGLPSQSEGQNCQHDGSVRAPARPRLDAREAASKLANMF